VCWFCKQPGEENSWMALGALKATETPVFECVCRGAACCGVLHPALRSPHPAHQHSCRDGWTHAAPHARKCVHTRCCPRPSAQSQHVRHCRQRCPALTTLDTQHRGRHILFHDACAAHSWGARDVPREGMHDAEVCKFWTHSEKGGGMGFKCALCGLRCVRSWCVFQGAGWRAAPRPLK
jgi:hypothetical protein